MGEAAKISLKAIGKQDTHLLSNDPEDSLFNYNEHPRHSEFRKYHNVYNVNQGPEATWPFGETIRVELNPKNMGDLLNNVWIQMKLPDWNFQDITFNETVQKILFGGKTLAEFGFGGETEAEQFRKWWLAGAPNVVGITLPLFSFPNFESFRSFEQQFDDLLLTLLPSELFTNIPPSVLFKLLGIVSGTTEPGPQLLIELGIKSDTLIPVTILNFLNGTTQLAGIQDIQSIIQNETDAELFALLPDIVKQIVTGTAPPPEYNLPEIADWAWDLQLLGRKIIKNVKFIVGNQTLEEISADWCIIHDNMYTNDSQKMSANTLYNRNIVGGKTAQPSGQKAAQSNEIFIHIPFFFSHNYAGDVYSENDQNKAPFPLCAIHNQKIILEIEFFKQSFFTLYNQRKVDNLNTRGLPVTPPPKKMPNFNVVTEEITLSPEERLYFMRPNQEIMYDFVFKHSSIPLEPSGREFVVQLEPSVPVKCFHWFFRYEGYEDENEYRSLPVSQDNKDTYTNRWFYSTTANRFNFTRSQIDDMNEPHLLKRAYFTLNDERVPNVSNNDREYFFSYTPLRSRLSRSATDVTRTYDFEPPSPNYLLNYIYTYNFAMFPKSTSPSGYLDFSGLNSEKTKLYMEMVDDTSLQYGNGQEPIQNPEYKFHMYYTGYKKLTFSNGFLLQT
jgi:hypothetical protein